MEKFSVLAGSTSRSFTVFIEDSTVTTGAGKTGLTFASFPTSHAYYTWSGAFAASHVITLVTIPSNGSSFTSSGFREIDATNMPGYYRFDAPNAALIAGKGPSVKFVLQGATGAKPCVIDADLTAWDSQTKIHDQQSTYTFLLSNTSGTPTTTTTPMDGTGVGFINYVGMRLEFLSGTGVGQQALITAIDTSFNIFTHSPVLTPADNTTICGVFPAYVSVQDIAANTYAFSTTGTSAIANGGIGLANLSAALKQLLLRGYLVSTGNASPAAAGVWTEDALWTNEPTYVLAGGAFVAWKDADGTWKISPAAGNIGTSTNYWQTAVGATVVGPYVKGTLAPGTTTGIPVISFHGNGVLGAFQPNIPFPANFGAMNITAGGLLTLASTQSFSNTGTGSHTVIINVKDASTAVVIVGATVKVSGAQAAAITTDLSGNVTLNLNSGTVTVQVNSPGYSNYNPTTHTIDGSGHWDGGGSATLSLTMAAVVIPSPSSPNQIVGTLYTRKPDDTTQAAVVIQFQMTDPPPGEGGNDYDDTIFNVTSDGTGLVSYPFTKGAAYQYKNLKGGWVKFTAPLIGTTFPINDGLGKFAG